MSQRRGLFGSLRQSLENAVQRTIQAIENTAEKAILSIQNLGRSEENASFEFQDRSQERADERAETIRQIEEEARKQNEQITQEAQNQQQSVDEQQSLVDELDTFTRKWYDAIGDYDLALQAADSGIPLLTAKDLSKVLSDNTKVRRTPHATYESALEYISDVPRGIVKGITKRGNFYYAVLDSDSDGNVKRRKKRRVRNKRR